MQANHRRIFYTARRGRLHSAGWEFALAVVIAAVVALLFLGIVGYLAAADERAAVEAASYRHAPSAASSSPTYPRRASQSTR